MSLLVQRDLGELRAGLERWLGRAVGTIERPAPGFSCETVVVDDELVIRLPPLAEGIFPAYDLEAQAAVQAAAGRAGVPVAEPCRYEPDPSFLGAGFVVMPFVAGPIPKDFTPIDPWLTGLSSDAERRSVWEAYLDALVVIHRTPTDGLGLRTGLAQELHAWEVYVGWSTDGSPPADLVEVLAWCRANLPGDEPAHGLLWGDVRLGNVVFDPDTRRPAAILDWDLASAGPAELDVAWHLALEDVQTDVSGMRVPGFGTRPEALARVEAGLGRPLQDLHWYEVFALARASAIATRITVLYERAGQRAMFRVGEDPTLAAAVAKLS